ncbi:MAG: Uma2 family endonuclease [Granulosicoccus sp.]
MQNPAVLGDFSEPQPDFAVLKPRDDFYIDSHPQPMDVLLVVEVSDSSLRYDRKIKMPLYAKYGMPEAWLIDLQGSTLTVHRDPQPDSYGDVRVLTDLSNISLAALADVSIDLSAFF